ncbi:MAG: hypothetical protein CM15mP62_29410 [Rhodospirillaceae bacterium]|nr:MAG: hypothetical protein CM15mP62_29410 [Rhodospirillaceae bacterium]
MRRRLQRYALNKINQRLDTTQSRVSTGLKVASSLDDASAFAVAQGYPGRIRALNSVIQGLNNSRQLEKSGGCRGNSGFQFND